MKYLMARVRIIIYNTHKKKLKFYELKKHVTTMIIIIITIITMAIIITMIIVIMILLWIIINFEKNSKQIHYGSINTMDRSTIIIVIIQVGI